jgi:subtilisin family serine protease
MVTASVHHRRLAAACALVALAFGAALASASPSSAAPATAGSEAAAIPGQLVVGFDQDASRSQQRRAVSQAGARIEDRVGSIDAAVVVAKPGRGAQDVADQLSSDGAVDFVEPNYRLRASRVPNDVMLHQLWALHNTGQLGGKVGSDIGAEGAWDVTTGGDVTVAVVDTGIDYRHADLRNNMWVNPADPPNGVDDDGNGFIDDVHGIDLANSDGDPTDDSSHGTHVAGIIGAEGNNAIGTVGVNWRVRLMALKFLDRDGAGNTADAAQAIDYAVSHGARVINASWGGPAYSLALYRAIQAAAVQGAVVVAAAGNEGDNSDASPEYPAAYDLPNIVSVAASDSSDQLADFSNYGRRTVDLAAPGDEIYSTVPSSFAASGYAAYSGTSMAAPFVAGAAALYLSREPNAIFPQIRDALFQSVDPRPSLTGTTVTGGRLNVGRMLAATQPPPAAQVGPTKDATAPSPFSLITPRNRYRSRKRGVRFRWHRARDSGGIAYYQLYVDGKKRKTIRDPDGPGGRSPSRHTWYRVRGGRHRWFVRAVDYSGNTRRSKRSHGGGRVSRVLFVRRHR